jgi:hypothetical protein
MVVALVMLIGGWATLSEIERVLWTELASLTLRVKLTGELVVALGVPLIVAVAALKERPAGRLPVRV